MLSWILFPHHCVRFPCSGLSISEDTHIIALKSMKQHLLADVLINLPLRCKGRVFFLKNRNRGQVWRNCMRWDEQSLDFGLYIHYTGHCIHYGLTFYYSEYFYKAALNHYTNTKLSTLASLCNWSIFDVKYSETHRAVWPIWIVKGEVLGWILGLFGISNTCKTYT